MFKAIPRENLYPHTPGVFMAMRQAVEAAVQHLGTETEYSPAWTAYLEEAGLQEAARARSPYCLKTQPTSGTVNDD